jgi:hypothetical protein
VEAAYRMEYRIPRKGGKDLVLACRSAEQYSIDFKWLADSAPEVVYAVMSRGS